MGKIVENTLCSCGKIHSSTVGEVFIGDGAIENLSFCVEKYGAKKVFLIADINTIEVAGAKVKELLKRTGAEFCEYVFTHSRTEPDEYAVGSVVMNYDAECDLIVGIGSGVINDISKIISKISGNPFIIVATAPSMDGYASASSSIVMGGVKISLSTRCPDVIIGDTGILKTAPVHMLKAGLGDMLAKFVSLCEWKISSIVTGEYYCKEIASYIRDILKSCIEKADGLLNKDEKCIEAVFEGLVACGKAMEYAGLSRPASGVEHYFSHVWDMRGLEFGTKTELHGIQCAIATLYAIKMYEKLKKHTPDREKALSHAKSFDMKKWEEDLKKFLGKSSVAMIELEKKEKKYDVQSHSKRIEIIISNWNKIIDVIEEELPSSEEFEKILNLIEAPKDIAEIGLDEKILPMTFKAAADIRYKYVLCHLSWDLGITDELLN